MTASGDSAARVPVELPLRRFWDELGAGERFGRGGWEALRGRSAESSAVEYLIEHRRGPRAVSINHPDRMALRDRGQSHPTEDVEGTCDAIELAAEVIPVAWRGAVLASVAWNLGPASLRFPAGHPKLGGGLPWLARAGFPEELPAGLSRHQLRRLAQHLRAALEVLRLVVGEERRQRGPRMDEPGPRERRRTHEEAMDEEKPLRGYKNIGGHLGVSVRSVQRMAAEEDLPVYQRGQGKAVEAYPSELKAWRAKQRRQASGS